MNESFAGFAEIVIQAAINIWAEIQAKIGKSIFFLSAG